MAGARLRAVVLSAVRSLTRTASQTDSIEQKYVPRMSACRLERVSRRWKALENSRPDN